MFRFAPSPNGRLHLGHAFSALLNLKMARQAGGTMLLRIEDTDRTRCTPALEAHMLRDLEWLGFEWDAPPRRQSEHLDTYRQVIDAMQDEGLAYPAFLGRGEMRREVERLEAQSGCQWPCDPDGAPHYPGVDREMDPKERALLLDEGKPHAMRLHMSACLTHVGLPEAARLYWQETGHGPAGETGTVGSEPAHWGDFLLAGRDVGASYHLACVIDDARQGITRVVRGRDLFHSTAAQRLLQEILGYPAPAYCHHDLILDDSGRKLSKSRGDTAIAALREAGATPADIRRMVGLAP